MSTYFRAITTLCVLLICLMSFSCSSVLINKKKYANSYKILSYNAYVLRDYNVILAKRFSGELVLILVSFEHSQPYNEREFSIVQYGRTYRLDLHPYPDTYEFEAATSNQGYHRPYKYFDGGYFRYKGKSIIDYYDVQSKYLMLPSYYADDLYASNQTKVILRKKPH